MNTFDENQGEPLDRNMSDMPLVQDIVITPEEPQENSDRAQQYLLPASVIVAGLFIAGAVLWNNQHPGPGGSAAGPQVPPSAVPVNIKDVKTAGEPFIGDPQARVTIAFWADFQCPFCKRFEQDALPQIIKNYVDTGKAKVVFKDFAFLGNDSITAGEYNRAVWKLYPDKYFIWRTAMYDAQDAENGGFGNAASIDKLNATIAGFEAARIAADVKANGAAYRAQMDANKAEAQKFGIGATPSFIIGKQMIPGALPYSAFKDAIDTALR